MRYVLTGGGTGGHVYPNLAIAGELARHDSGAQFLYIGVRGRAEEDIVPRHGLPIRFVAAQGLPDHKYSPRMVVFLAALLWGTLKALFILLRFRPHLVVATGGYASAPTLLAARLLRRAILVHEQNAYPGLVNRTFGKMAGRVCVSFPESLMHFQHNGVLVGYPVRPEIMALHQKISAEEKQRLKIKLGVDPHRTVILITGGSMGARSINRAVADLMPKIAADAWSRDHLFFMHGVGRFEGKEYHALADTTARLAGYGFNEEAAKPFYRREQYLYQIENWLRVADVLVCRAGAGSLAEAAAVGVPALVIPKNGLPGDHQVKNAETMAEAGACLVLREGRMIEADQAFDAVDPNRLLVHLRKLIELSPGQRADMAEAAWRFITPDCLTRIYGEAQALIAPPKPEAEKLQRRRTFLVDPEGHRIEVLFDHSRIGTGRWDDVRPTVAGLVHKHFWLKRTSRLQNGRVEETWTVVPRAELKIWHENEDQPQDIAGPTVLADSDRLVLPGGATFSLAFEWIEVTRVKTEKGAVENVFSQGLGTLAAKLIGFIREAFLGRFFGAGNIMDVFAVTLSLANLMREVVAEMALENAFLPSFRLFYGRSEDKTKAWQLAWQVFNLFFLLSVVITVVAVLTCPWWIYLVAPGFTAKGLIPQTVAMTRLMFPFLILMSLSAFFGTILQSFDRFGPNAFAPVLYSIALVVFPYLLFPVCGIYSLGVAVLVGGAMQVAFQVVFLLRRGMREKIAWNVYRPMIGSGPGMKKVVALSGPVFLDATLNKISGVVDKILATPLIAGSVSALYFSRLLIVMPFSVLAMSVSRVFLRDLSDVSASGDARRFRDLIQRGVEATVLLMVPTTAAIIALSTPLVRFIFEGRQFTPIHTAMTSSALTCYALGLLGWSMTALYSRVFSSQLDTRTSLMTNAGSLMIYLVFAVTLVHTSLAHAGLALATSFAFLFNTVWRHIIVVRRLAADGAPLTLSRLAPTLLKTAAASVVLVLVVILLFVEPGRSAGLLLNAWAFGFPAVAGTLAFLAFAYLLRIQPMLDLLNYYSARLGLGRPFGHTPMQLRDHIGGVRTLSADGLLAEARRRAFSAAEMEIVLERLDGYLRHDDWWIRNVGIKLIGALRREDKIDWLVEALTATAEKPWIWRRLLGSSKEVGLLRRNAVTSLKEIGVYNLRVRRALLAALRDRYYEVRQEALRLILHFIGQTRSDAEILAAVRARLNDGHFEVLPVAIKAYAELAERPETFADVRILLADSRWPVRAAAAEACRRLYDRRVMTDVAMLREALADTLMASEMIEPISPLKRALKDAMTGLPDKEQ